MRRAALLMMLSTATLAAQRGQSPRAAAPVDLTGYWVTVVTEDWRYRMVTPARGDHPSVPLNATGNGVANTWDPAKDEAAGEQCRAYGAAGVMRLPGRIHITWQDEATLKIETEEGTQTRLLKLGSPQPDVKESWQGDSAAQWEFAVVDASAVGQSRRGRRVEISRS